MRSTLTAVAALWAVALGGTAHAGGNGGNAPVSRCDLQGLGVLVNYVFPEDPDVPAGHTNKHIIWSIQGTGATADAAPGPPLPEGLPQLPRAIAVADFRADGTCYILWENHVPHDPTHLVRLALTDGFRLPTDSDFDSGWDRPALPWQIAGAADFTSDGAADVLWWNHATGEAVLWIAREDGEWKHADVSGTPHPVFGPQPAENWRPVGTTRLDTNSGTPGVLWHDAEETAKLKYHPAQWTGQVLMLLPGQEVPGAVQENWSVVALGDFDGNGYEDLLRQHATTRTLQVCFLSAGQVGDCPDVNPPLFTDPQGSGAPWFVVGPR